MRTPTKAPAISSSGRPARWFVMSGAMALLALQLTSASPSVAAAEEEDAPTPVMNGLPLLFEHAPDGSMVARSHGYTTAIQKDGVGLALAGRSIRLTFAGTAAAAIRAEDPLTTRVNYMIGPRAEWRTGVLTFARVRLQRVYPGVDVLFYGNERHLEYDFELEAGVSPDVLEVRFEGADAIRLDDEGNLLISIDGEMLKQHRPVAYQQRRGVRTFVDARYVVSHDEVRFAVGAYDAALPLVIDPVISYSTYFGATGYDVIEDIAIDADGSALIVGSTIGSDFPVTSLRPKPNAPSDSEPRDAYVARFAPDGTPQWFSFYGGTREDMGTAVAVGPGGDVFFAGMSHSQDFPTTPGAFDPTPSPGGTFESRDAFVVRLSSDGTQVRYATMLGGSRTEWTDALAVDSAGRAYVGGATESQDFPVTTGGAGLGSSDRPDGFVARLSADGGALEMSRFIAGDTADWVADLAVDAMGDVYVTGSTNSDVFPVRSPLRGSKFEPGSGDADHGYDVFAMRLTPAGEIRFSTYLGGMREDSVGALGLGPDGSIYLAGSTASDAFTGTSGSRANANTFTQDAFIIRLAADGSRVLSGRYYGGTSDDWITDLVVDRFGVLSTTGTSARKLFAAQFLPDLELSDVQIFGGSGNDSARALAVDARGDSWIAGWTASTDFPVVNGVQSSWKGPQSFHPDGFLTKFSCQVRDTGYTPSHRVVGPEGATGTIVLGMDPGCALDPRPTVSWIHITGIDANKVHYRVEPYSGTVSREGLVMILPEQGIRVTQRAAGTSPSGNIPEVVLNAEDVSFVKGSWFFDTDGSDEHVTVVQRDAGRPKIAPALASPEHYFEMTFYAEAGRPYRLWVLGNAHNQHWANDSIHVQFSGAVDASNRAIYRIGSTSSTDVNLEDCSGCGVPFGWSWEDNGWGSPGAFGPEIRFATSGRQTLRVQTREDGMSIGQIVLSAEKYLRAAPQGQWISPPAAGVTEQVRYARDASSVNGAWRFVADATAAGGERLAHPDGGGAKLNAPLAAPANYVDVTVHVEAGRPYRLWLRLTAERNYWGNDSVWVQFTNSEDTSGKPLARVGSTTGLSVNLEECSGCGIDAWGWRDDGWGSSPAPLGTRVVFATSGPQTIRVQTREDGVSFDQLVLSADVYLNTPPGTAKRDTTILVR